MSELNLPFYSDLLRNIKNRVRSAQFSAILTPFFQGFDVANLAFRARGSKYSLPLPKGTASNKTVYQKAFNAELMC